jgi:hypothetical protein
MHERMPWRCPACLTPLRLSELEEQPRPGVSYRCHVCRLELEVNPDTQRLVALPAVEDEPRKNRTVL